MFTKRGESEYSGAFVVLLFAVAGVFLMVKFDSYTGLDVGLQEIPVQDQPGLVRIPMMDCQGSCFGRAPGEPEVGQQQGYGGAELRQCLADCQQGIPFQHPEIQECYHFNCPSEGVTADDHDMAMTIGDRVCGSSAAIVSVDAGPCKY